MKDMEGKKVKVYESDGQILFGTLLRVYPGSVTIRSDRDVLHHLPITKFNRIELCV